MQCVHTHAHIHIHIHIHIYIYTYIHTYIHTYACVINTIHCGVRHTIPPAHRILGLLAGSEAYEFGQLGCPGSGNIVFQRRMSIFFAKEPTTSLTGDPELQPQS